VDHYIPFMPLEDDFLCAYQDQDIWDLVGMTPHVDSIRDVYTLADTVAVDAHGEEISNSVWSAVCKLELQLYDLLSVKHRKPSEVVAELEIRNKVHGVDD
jgi:hypothetical protein